MYSQTEIHVMKKNEKTRIQLTLYLLYTGCDFGSVWGLNTVNDERHEVTPNPKGADEGSLARWTRGDAF